MEILEGHALDPSVGKVTRSSKKNTSMATFFGSLKSQPSINLLKRNVNLPAPVLSNHILAFLYVLASHKFDCIYLFFFFIF